jgi:hypothetical protein
MSRTMYVLFLIREVCFLTSRDGRDVRSRSCWSNYYFSVLKELKSLQKQKFPFETIETPDIPDVAFIPHIFYVIESKFFLSNMFFSHLSCSRVYG